MLFEKQKNKINFNGLICIYCKFCLNFDFVYFLVPYLQRTFKNLKDSLKKCLDKRKAMTRSGAAAGTLPMCKYFELMCFLHEKTSNLPTSSNVEIDIPEHSLIESVETEINTPQEEIPSATNNIPLPLSTCSTPVNGGPPLKRTRRKNSNEQKSDHDPFLDQMKNMDEKILNCIQLNKENENDEATLFCRSLIPALKDMDKKKIEIG